MNGNGDAGVKIRAISGDGPLRPTGSSHDATGRDSIGAQLAGRRVLYVGPTPELPAAVRGLHDTAVFHSTLEALTPPVMQKVAPDVVLAELFGAPHDILDVARKLDRLGYGGALRAFCEPLPSRNVVLSEVRQVWSPRDFGLYEFTTAK